ncbi:MAG TPA: M14 family metallopeptidase [Bryobacteraceae bacterium]|nr:M14 family metallopeptidase [Bryobacteraceae bacterium]
MNRFFLILALAASAFAHDSTELWAGAKYDPAVPTEKSVLGHEPGERISSPAEIVKYMQTLAAAAPTRMKVFEYGETWEHRKLIYAVIGSETNIGRLPEIQADMMRLADPRKTNAAEAKQAIAKLPALVWLAYGVHGNEISSPDSALMTAYHLLASKDDKLVDEILAKDVILIDPLQNPDGRNRFVHDFEVAEGLRPDANQLAAEHNEPWPGGRTNHYYFDMNRDWFAMTQPETRGRIAAVRQWLPLVFVDLHEMGSDSTYYFAPEANPYNPYITDTQKNSLEWFGKNNARYFDQLGFSYFTKEGYDEFYPGYGASWPLYYGSIGMTYEQASTRGLIVRKADNTVFTYRDTVQKHFITSISTAETAARNREKLLENFYQYRKESIEEGSKGPIREYILVREGNVSEVDKLAANLADQGIEIKRATATFQNGGKSYPEGSYIIDFAQPSFRLLRALLDTQVSMKPEFLAGEEHRRLTRQASEMYDVTAWSLPLQCGIRAEGVAQLSTGSFEALPNNYTRPGSVIGGTPEVAYLVPWGISASVRLLSGALQQGLRVATTDRSFTQNGHSYPSGTLIIKTKENPGNLPETMSKLAASSGADVYTTNTAWMDAGPNFGSRYVSYIPTDMKIAMAWDRPTSASAAGAARYVLERQYGYPVTAIRTQQLANADLSQFKTILLPDGGFGEGYEAVLGANGDRRLRDWVESGGTLVALGPGAVSYLADRRVGMLALSQENAAHESERATPAAGQATGKAAARTNGGAAEGEQTAQPQSNRVPGKLLTSEKDFDKAITADAELPDSLHGVLLRAKVNQESWVTAGVPETVNVLVTGRTIFSPIKMDRGLNAVYYEGPDQILASGFMWEPNRKQLAYKPFLVVQRAGRGNIVAFTADPNFRGYMDGLNVLFLNAVFRGPAHTGSGGGFGEEQ